MPIHLKNNGPHIKVPLIFWFLTMTFDLCFYHQLWVKWVCVHIGNNSRYIEQTYLWFLKCLWICETEWNAHQIGILDNLFDQRNLINTSSISPSEVKRKGAVRNIYSTFNNFVYLKRNLHWIFKDKIFNLF